ncbi:MAG: Dabb family protein [Actinomycetota bacterium]
MFRHVSLLTFRDGTTSDEIAAIVDALRALAARIPALRDYRVGADAGLAAGNASFVVVADFDDEAGYAAYRDHPEHRRIGTDLIAAVLASRTAAQYRC